MRSDVVSRVQILILLRPHSKEGQRSRRADFLEQAQAAPNLQNSCSTRFGVGP
jgi:hypothetical protein